MAATLRGRLHEIELTPAAFIEAADELVPQMPEPYPHEDVVYAFMASRKAKELGHDLVVAGDGGDGVLGGADTGPFSRKAFVIWKTLDPNRVLGLRTLQPYCHPAVFNWARFCLAPAERDRRKRFAARFCRELGMPAIVSEQAKAYWAGAHGTRRNPKVLQHMNAVVDRSDYRCLRDIRFPLQPRVDLPFRLYGLVRWLEANHAERLSPADVRDLERSVDRLKIGSGRPAESGWKQLVPPAAVPALLRARYVLRRYSPIAAADGLRRFAGHLTGAGRASHSPQVDDSRL